MWTITVLLLALLSILSLTHATAIPNPAADANPSSIGMILNNNCNFDVWVRQGVAAEPGSRKGQGETCGPMSGKDTQEVKLAAGQKYITTVPVLMDSCGHSVKVARKPADWQTCYQYEFNWAKENRKIWYNLSSLNGNPFTDVARQLGGPYGSTCQYFRCQPGNDGSQCDYPLIGNCATVGDLVGYLC
ncbi:uncharacterized protein J4E84_001696 [Alternaria hordeiaustralica]|uniref:uncharacterized protein n=1 Tax=Alternaria hordeiaustralica TaxID=1187925 RepID=UPI0020C4CA11|nr:uncharacterized protein J4E84_001696 [Alternaria hordeiaustralica]KAI4695072.1 hypothetical protein J4E84_001696 [Alternaria hordeiaustralica]